MVVPPFRDCSGCRGFGGGFARSTDAVALHPFGRWQARASAAYAQVHVVLAKEVHMSARNYWIGVVSKARAQAMVAGGFAEVNRGKAGPLERMRKGDGFAVYSPRSDEPDGARVQAFTAIGCVGDGSIVQTQESDGAVAFRRGVRYGPARDAPIKPLIEALSFIRSKVHWGAPFRFGFIRVSESDFALIAMAMGRDFERDFPGAEASSRSHDAGSTPAHEANRAAPW
jgi:hypothetical protein